MYVSTIGKDIAVIDDGFIITGSVIIGDDTWGGCLIKTDKSGNFLWIKYLERNRPCGKYVATMNDGFIIAGETKSKPFGRNIYLIKTDLKGDKIWDKVYKSTGRYNNFGNMAILRDGFIIVGGISYKDKKSDVWLIKTDFSGNTDKR